MPPTSTNHDPIVARERAHSRTSAAQFQRDAENCAQRAYATDSRSLTRLALDLRALAQATAAVEVQPW